MIFEYLPPSALRCLAYSSKYFYAFCIPILYRHIDSSIHNDLRVMCEVVEPRARRIQIEQLLFIKQLQRKPEYISYVYSLTWTMGLNKIVSQPSWINDRRNDWRLEDTYYMFALLNRAILSTLI